MAHNFHSNAAALIIAAAKKSGLFDEIAEALCFIDKVPYPSFDCPACELLGNLADAFDEHAVLPNLTIRRFAVGGVDIPADAGGSAHRARRRAARHRKRRTPHTAPG